MSGDQLADPGGDATPDPDERTPDDPAEAVAADGAATPEDYEPRDPDPEVTAGKRPDEPRDPDTSRGRE